MNALEPLLSNGSRAFKNYDKKVIFYGVIKYHRYIPASYVEILDCFRVGLVPKWRDWEEYSVALNELSMHANLKALLSGGGDITDFFRRPAEDDAAGADDADEQ